MHELALLDLIDAYPGLDPHWVETNQANADAALADVPVHYREATVTDPGVRAWAVELCHSAAKSARAFNPIVATGPSLLLLGPVGTGKTHESFGAIRQIAHSGVAVSWAAITAADLYAELRPKERGNPEAAMARYQKIPLLLLDDLGAAKTSEWTEEITFRVINHRYEHHLATIVTSNLGGAELRNGLGERVASRLREMSRQVALKGEDRRRALRPAG
jgi:DNA replication protein DnaC